MNTQRLIDKLTSWPVTLSVCLLIVLGTLTVKLWPRTVPFDQCSDVYRKYADMDGFDASFIKDYKVNDSVFVNVTMLEARDTAIWNRLLKDFNIYIPDEMLPFIDSNSVFLKYAPHNNYTATMDSIILNNDIIVYAYLKRTILVFEIENERQNNAIINHKILSTNPKNQSK